MSVFLEHRTDTHTLAYVFTVFVFLKCIQSICQNNVATITKKPKHRI